jgi:hypothetical protein
MENYFGAILKYRQNSNGIEMMRFEPFRSEQDYHIFIAANEGIYEPVQVPAEQDDFYRMLGYYSAREI